MMLEESFQDVHQARKQKGYFEVQSKCRLKDCEQAFDPGIQISLPGKRRESFSLSIKAKSGK